MPEDLSIQILSQTSDSIQRLFELSTRIDERVKEIQSKQSVFHDDLDTVISGYQDVLRKIAVLQAKEASCPIRDVTEGLGEFQREVNEIDKRLVKVEGTTDRSQDRWNRIFTFMIQLVWVLLAAWLLMKLNIQAPAVP